MNSTTENKLVIEKLDAIRENAIRLLEDTAALKNELSGGSDSSISNEALPRSLIQQLISRRRNCQLGTNKKDKDTRSAS